MIYMVNQITQLWNINIMHECRQFLLKKTGVISITLKWITCGFTTCSMRVLEFRSWCNSTL